MTAHAFLRFGSVSVFTLVLATAAVAGGRFDPSSSVSINGLEQHLLLIADDEGSAPADEGVVPGDEGEGTGSEVTYDPIIAENGVALDEPSVDEPSVDEPSVEEPGAVPSEDPEVVSDGEVGPEAWSAGGPIVQRDFGAAGGGKGLTSNMHAGEGGSSVLNLLMRDRQRSAGALD